ncbi:40S ribosomal protein S8 [Plasmodiophora brassicae]|uniref:40S ribosomal protein S8 n=1 Tax=Plasmodiophora brassicae TaxID=37360 RepID=A0A0G4J4T2_PLABS|nr:hypothetical protein PBRA_008865 [Plasmodiophora brassicae]SPR01675.1 unnamed protein product [Plasmodiophora brassicae]
MGISRDSRHKRRATGGRRKIHQKKKKYELGRPAANTKIGEKRIHVVRCRGGNLKFRALRLETGNFSWGSEVTTRRTRIIDVVYNATSNELVRTKTLVKGAIVVIDATPFRQWYTQHYGVDLGLKKHEKGSDEITPVSATVDKKHKKRLEKHVIDPKVEEQFVSGRLYACIASRPGQCGRCDGYILEGKELEFYMKKVQKKKHK